MTLKIHVAHAPTSKEMNSPRNELVHTPHSETKSPTESVNLPISTAGTLSHAREGTPEKTNDQPRKVSGATDGQPSKEPTREPDENAGFEGPKIPESIMRERAAALPQIPSESTAITLEAVTAQGNSRRNSRRKS